MADTDKHQNLPDAGEVERLAKLLNEYGGQRCTNVCPLETGCKVAHWCVLAQHHEVDHLHPCTVARLRAELSTARANIDAFWLALERSWEIEPRSYFEKEAPENGFGSPLAMAVHHMWKRDTNTVEARANAINECIRSLPADSDLYTSDEIATALQSLLDKKEGEDGPTGHDLA